jgi:uncharacterized protein
VDNDNLVVDVKGIYSIEKFLIARRLMYWQVYLHKTVVSAEQLLIQLLLRARELSMQGHNLWCSPSLQYFLSHNITQNDFKCGQSPSLALQHFANIDDSDIMVAAKQWINHQDMVLSTLAKMVTTRRLFKVELRNNPFTDEEQKEKEQYFVKKNPALAMFHKYFVITNSISNNAYRVTDESIKILYNTGALVDIADASDMLNTKTLSREIKKYFLCYPK